MAKTKEKPTVKKSVKVIKNLRTSTESKTTATDVQSLPLQGAVADRSRLIAKIILVVVVGTALYFIASKYKNLILVGTVNSSPVYRWEINSRMSDKYAKQTFDEIVSDRILASELQKNKIVVTDKEVNDEMAKLVTQYGGEDAFKKAITQFNLTEDKAKESIKQSIGLKKIVEKNYKIEITDDSVKKYFADNKATFGTKKFEEVSTDIKDTLYQQEVYTKSQEWFAGVRKDAKVVSFI